MEEATIRRLPLHADRPLDPIDPTCLEQRYPRGRPIIRQGEPCGRLFLVRAGVVREYSVLPCGREVVLGLWGPGQIFGRLPPLVELPSPTYVRAMTDCRLASVGQTHLQEMLRHRPFYAASLMGAIGERARRLGEVLEKTLAEDVSGRVMHALRSLARDHGEATPEGAMIAIDLTQEDLAGMVGASRETVNRSLASLIAEHRLRIERRRYLLVERDGDWEEDRAG
jgi:CRP-like cAMP-binding protein